MARFQGSHRFVNAFSYGASKSATQQGERLSGPVEFGKNAPDAFEVGKILLEVGSRKGRTISNQKVDDIVSRGLNWGRVNGGQL